MRVDVRENPAIAGRYLCYLDGEDISDVCFSADDEEGWADCYVLDEHGSKMIHPLHDEARTHRRYGAVRLEHHGS